jgi:pantoate--beta-alanine ligase
VKTLRTPADVRLALSTARGQSTIGLVPTMGALHEGHLALIAAARASCDLVVATLFVNPTQFGDANDLSTYPRDEAADERAAAAAGVDFLFAPGVNDMYPPGYATWIDVEGPARGLEGDFRPGHFRGVATICLKLFNTVRPHVAFFGQKDAQQVAVVQRLVRDLDLDLEIRVVPTVRDTDGVALSSRNARLSADDRRRARAIPKALAAGLAAHRAGRDAADAARAELAGLDLDYVAVAELEGRPTLALAARIGGTRLIDNVPLDSGDEALVLTRASRLPGGV